MKEKIKRTKTDIQKFSSNLTYVKLISKPEKPEKEINDNHRENYKNQQFNTRICKYRILASDYCLHNQLRFHNSIKFEL